MTAPERTNAQDERDRALGAQVRAFLDKPGSFICIVRKQAGFDVAPGALSKGPFPTLDEAVAKAAEGTR